MNKIKKIFFLILISSIIFIFKTNAKIEDGLFMTVGNKAVTKSDVVNEIKIILILTNQSYSDKKREELHKLAVKSIIDRNVKLIEIEKHKYFEFNPEDLNKELIRLATNIKVDVDTLKNICSSNEVDFQIIEDQIKIELYWNSLIFQIYKNRLSVNAEDIDEKLKLIQNEKKIEYLISEILIKPEEQNELESEINKIKKKIELEGFENVAKNLSTSPSAVNGGDLGWLNEDTISKKIKAIIIETKVGEISKPITLDSGILFFKVREKRIIRDNLTLEERKNKLVNIEKTKILNIHSLAHFDKVRRSVSVEFPQ